MLRGKFAITGIHAKKGNYSENGRGKFSSNRIDSEENVMRSHECESMKQFVSSCLQ